ncbi:hypothetical protein M0812_26296 [Anaeramoeba flamelloides]|uniref:Uncharacterized protein n=1 Tax=Anaeramoeba flamelloides TaxID=1746091 RepID=A0AAV7YAA4_9EUKA|nr:hypothetical protein M0812_26296 [Anaeramoeba flamelloides]
MGGIEWLKVEKNDLKSEIQRLSKEREANQSIEEDNFVFEKRIFAVTQRLAFEQRRQIALSDNIRAIAAVSWLLAMLSKKLEWKDLKREGLRKEAKETRWKLEEQIFAEKQKVKELSVEYEKLKKEKEEERKKEKQNATDVGVQIKTLRTALMKRLSIILKKEVKKDHPVQGFQNNYKEIQEMYMGK